MIIIEQTGPLALVQDLGRPGLSRLGVSASGAADRAALRLANRLVGNHENSACVEVTLGGLVITADRSCWCVVTGAPTDVVVDGRAVGSHHSFHLRAGQSVQLAPPDRGLRNYLAVRGGLDVDLTLGSASTDVLAGLGPEPLRPGDRLAVGMASLPFPSTSFAPVRQPPGLRDNGHTLAISPGPRRDWFTAAAWQTLLETTWQVSPDSNRVGVRLDGPAVERQITDELPSEGILAGAVQVPASGQPLIFGPDHPLTGGYPVFAVLTAAARDLAGQLRGGDQVRMRIVGAGSGPVRSRSDTAPRAGS